MSLPLFGQKKKVTLFFLSPLRLNCGKLII
jgi:hypothetical protein